MASGEWELGSRYIVETELGQGGMGVVWRGRGREGTAAVAVKTLRPELAADPQVVARFVRERTVLTKVRHPNIVSVHDMIMEGGRLALVMDLVEGEDLRQYLRRSGGTLNPAEALRIMAQICDGLAAAHAAGIVHRDLKPANVLLDSRRTVKLVDFGIAHIADGAALTSSGVIIGTAHYMAPETVQGLPATPACDIYAAGITLYELLVGTTPFEGGSMAAVLHRHASAEPERPEGVSDELWSMIAQCLAKDPATRPSAETLAAALRGSDGSDHTRLDVRPQPASLPSTAHPVPEPPPTNIAPAHPAHIPTSISAPDPAHAPTGLASAHPAQARQGGRGRALVLARAHGRGRALVLARAGGRGRVLVLAGGVAGVAVVGLLGYLLWPGSTTSTKPNELRPGHSLTVSRPIWSPNHAYQLVLQPDGNVVEYRGSNQIGNAMWASGTMASIEPVTAMLQTNGDFVVRDGQGQAHFLSNTAGHPSDVLVINDDGSLVIEDHGKVIWRA